jgi:MoxR-like ATPase
MPTPATKPQHKIMYNDTGKALIDSITRHEGKPLILRARKGMGKSVVLEQIGRKQGRKIAKVNLFKTAKARTFFGSYYPNTNDFGLHWEDQVWTELCRPSEDCSYPAEACICDKTMLIIDEINRGNEDIQARLLSMTEDGRPYIVLLEKGNDAFTIHPNVWMVGTMNPIGGGYSTNPLDAALEDRFRFYEVDNPIADEQVILDGLLPKDSHGEMSGRLMNFALDLRKSEETYMSTRGVTMIAKSLLYGEPVVQAIKVNYLNMLTPEQRAPVDAIVRTHFDAEWKASGGISNLLF